MTEDELDTARAKEAMGVWQTCNGMSALSMAIRAARLAREGWMPVDPDLVEAREILAVEEKRTGNTACYPEDWRNGLGDKADEMVLTVAAIKRGRELERGQ